MRLALFSIVAFLLIAQTATAQIGPQPCAICFEIGVTTCLEEFGPVQSGDVPLLCTGTCEINYMQPNGICNAPVTSDQTSEIMPHDWAFLQIPTSEPVESGEGWARRSDIPAFRCATRASCEGCELCPFRNDYFCRRLMRELNIAVHMGCIDAQGNPILCGGGPLR